MVSVLFPPRDWFVADKPQNNDSMVLRVSYGESSVLLEGDAEKQVERRVAALHHPSASLLKVGHHGSANATTAELVASAKPEFAIISVGSGNSFGLPRQETLARLADAGTRVYRTDLDGAVTLLPRRPLASRLLWRLFNSFDLRGFVVVGRRLAILGNELPRFLRIFFAHQNDHSPESGKCILHQGRRGKVAVDASRIEQTFHHQSL